MNTMVRTLTPEPADESTPAIAPSHPTLGEIMGRVNAARARMGNVGRFALTTSFGDEVECYATHWFRPDKYSFEDCRAVGSGTVRDCLDAIDQYADCFKREAA